MKSQLDNSAKGTITNIQRFSLHDGPGIRTTVFLKGCPLKCPWCSNPETQAHYPEIMVFSSRCIGCQKCVEVCPNQAIKLVEGEVAGIDRDKCNRCYKCAEGCPSKTLDITGRVLTVAEVMNEVLQDKLFYINSNGGVTFSGGEPLAQYEFLLNLLKEAKTESLHTTLDTTGFISWELFQELLEYVDLILYDVKHLDPGPHLQWTGIDNHPILKNLKRIAATEKSKIWIRFAVIPGFNDTKKHIEDLKNFVAEVHPQKISLLPYHTWGLSKYEKLGALYQLQEVQPPREEEMAWIKGELADCGPEVEVGR